MKLNYLYVYQALVLLAVAAGVRGDWPDQDDDATTGPFHHGDTINLLHKNGNFVSLCSVCNDDAYPDLRPTAVCKGGMTMRGDSAQNSWNKYKVHVVDREKRLVMFVGENQKLLGYTEQNGGSDDEPIYGIMFQTSPPDSDSQKPIKRYTWQWQKAGGDRIYLKAYVKKKPSHDQPDLYLSTCHKCRKLVNNASRVPDVATIRPSRDPDDDDDGESKYNQWKSDAILTVNVINQG